MSLTTDLEGILGAVAVRSDNETLQKYAADQSFVEPRRPDVIAFATGTDQVQEVIRYGNKTLTPVIPYSSGLNMHGATIPKEGGIVLDLSGMHKVLAVDQENWSAVIEPGVTAQQLQQELEPYHLRAMLPFGIHPQRSALTSYLERDPAVAAASFEYGNEHIMDTELVLPTGELFRTGLWSGGGKAGSPLGPVRAMMNRLWTGAQGTLGVLTKMNIKIEHLPKLRKIRMFQFDSFPEAIEPLKIIQHREIGHECFVINSFNAAALLCVDWQVLERFPAAHVQSKEFTDLREKLPPWTLVVCMNSGPRLGAEKIAYEDDALNSVVAQARLQRYNDAALENKLHEEMHRPWGILKKYCYRGSVHDVSFKTTLKRVPEFQRVLLEVLNKYNYPLQDVGVYVLIIERGRAVHCEFDIHSDPDNAQETLQAKSLWLELSQRFIDEGAFFDRPYGAWADMVYTRAGTYTQKLKQIKKELDPNNILNPGRLCF